MAEGMCANCAKYLLIIFNLIFWISGGAVLGIGIWMLVDPQIDVYFRHFIALNLPLDYLYIAAYILIGVGLFVFVVGFCGCCGAIRESPCMLGTYIACMVIVMAAEMAAGIYVAVQRGPLQKELSASIADSVSNYTSPYGNTTMDLIQMKFKCCGSQNYTDYRSSIWYKEVGRKAKTPVPESCCLLKDTNVVMPVNYQACQREAIERPKKYKHLHSQGCYKKLIEWLDENSIILIGVGIGIAFVELLGIVFAVCLCRHRTKYYD